MKGFVVIVLLTVFSVVVAQEKTAEKPTAKPYIKLTIEEIDRELSNIEALREQYIATLNMLEGQKQFLLKLKADTTRVIK